MTSHGVATFEEFLSVMGASLNRQASDSTIIRNIVLRRVKRHPFLAEDDLLQAARVALFQVWEDYPSVGLDDLKRLGVTAVTRALTDEWTRANGELRVRKRDRRFRRGYRIVSKRSGRFARENGHWAVLADGRVLPQRLPWMVQSSASIDKCIEDGRTYVPIGDPGHVFDVLTIRDAVEKVVAGDGPARDLLHKLLNPDTATLMQFRRLARRKVNAAPVVAAGRAIGLKDTEARQVFLKMQKAIRDLLHCAGYTSVSNGAGDDSSQPEEAR